MSPGWCIGAAGSRCDRRKRDSGRAAVLGFRRFVLICAACACVGVGGPSLVGAVAGKGAATAWLEDARLRWVALTGTDPVAALPESLEDPLRSGLLVALGLGLLGAGLRPRRGVAPEARRLSRVGRHGEAAELLLEAGEAVAAAEAFALAGDRVRAAEVLHDQNRFLEAAEHYVEAGQLESAAAVFAQQGAFARAGECYLEVGSDSVAAEMFEQAGEFARAADCFRKAEFLAEAAQCYAKVSRWRSAADCLAEVVREAGRRLGAAEAGSREVLAETADRAAAFYLKAEDPNAALGLLEAGGWDRRAADLAEQVGDFAKAAELFERAGDREAAAAALRRLGDDVTAARMLGEHLRAQGDFAAAAAQLRAAGEFHAAGDLYRQVDDPGNAAACYGECGEHAQAAEMHECAGDREAAANAWERAGHFEQAAECCALLGRSEREAALLERAGRFLDAGEAFQREGLDDAAIAAFQRVEGKGAPRAAAAIAAIFRARGQSALATRQLRDAIGEDDVTRDALPMFYALATLVEEEGRGDDALELYERIAAVDYHYEDVDERAARLRAQRPPEGIHVRGNGWAVDGDGRYEIVAELGRGGMGIVYEARDRVLDRRVAFKVLPDSFRENPQAVDNFLREAKAAAKLNHPNIVTVYDAGEQDGRYYIAMEYVDGTTFTDILAHRGALGTSGLLQVLVQLSGALAYAHEQGVVHRDIKTSNTMWTRDRKAKIMDFGLARVVEEVRNHTTVVAGTPCYMSPEQTLGRHIDHRTDIYSLGVMGFELVTGRLPFTEGNIPYHHVHTPAPAVQTLREGVPDSVAELIARCLEKDASRRFQSAAQLLAEALLARGDKAPDRLA